MRPFCQLVIKAVRWDSPPYANTNHSLAASLVEYRMKSGTARAILAAKLGVSLSTLKNWERGWTEPNRQFWPRIRALLS